MHISRRLLALGAASLGLSTAYPQDTDAQNKAVQILRVKIAELQRQANPVNAPPAQPASQAWLQRRAADALRRKQADLDRINAPNKATVTSRLQYEPLVRKDSDRTILMAAASSNEPETTEVQRKALEALRKAEADLRAEEERAKAAKARTEAKPLTDSEKKRDTLLSNPPSGDRENRGRGRAESRREAAPPPMTSVDLSSDPNREVHEKAIDALRRKMTELDSEAASSMPRERTAERARTTPEVRTAETPTPVVVETRVESPADVEHSEVHQKALEALRAKEAELNLGNPADAPRTSRPPPTARVLTPPMLRAPVLEHGTPPSRILPRQPRETIIVPPRTNAPPGTVTNTVPQALRIVPEQRTPSVLVSPKPVESAPQAPSAPVPPVSPAPGANKSDVGRPEVHEKAVHLLRQKQLELAEENSATATPTFVKSTGSVSAFGYPAPEASRSLARPWDAAADERFAMRPAPRPAPVAPRNRRPIVTPLPETEPVAAPARSMPEPAAPTIYDRAFEALHHKYLELNTAPPAPAVVVAPAPMRPVAPAAEAPNTSRPSRQTGSAVAPAAKPVVAARTAPPRTEAPVRATAVTIPAAQTEAVAPAPAAAPKGRQEKLAELLERYKADKVTPHEYQVERRKILSEQ